MSDVVHVVCGRALDGGGGLLGCVGIAGTGADGAAQLYFTPDFDTGRIDTAKTPAILDSRTIAGAPVVTLAHQPDSGPLVLWLRDGAAPVMTPAPPEPDRFAGLDCAIVERNGESFATVCDWLDWHARTQNLSGVLIVDRAPPEQGGGFADRLRDWLDGDGPGGLRITVLSFRVPLGKEGHGPERHPFNAPDAPGKDRMERPAPDPWSAPLGVSSIYELLRWRYLARARAVMNLNMNDILPAPGGAGGATVFERAANAPQGLVRLLGQRAYPWSLRKGKEARFGDHTCTQFDNSGLHGRWCVAPDRLPEGTTWRMVRLPNVVPAAGDARFFRCMSLRHRADGSDADKVSRIVPKSSLVENPALLELSRQLGHKPLRSPEITGKAQSNDRVTIVTTMKNEGPFILEWLAYHRAIGVDDFLVYTNDCDDGTDTMLELLQDRGIVQHRDNPYRESGLKPQHAALAASEKEPLVRNAGWLICMDVDEFLNIHTGDGTLAALFAAVPQANMISATWRLFGNGDIATFRDGFVTEQFTACAPQMTRKPHQAWGFKTLYRNIGLFKKMGVHRPKGLRPQLVDQVRWVNGSGRPMPQKEYRNAWRSTTRTVGYDLVTLNHYAVRSAESFLVKRDRGRVNHVDRDQGLAYWFRMNNNAETDTSIRRMLPALRAEYDALLKDPEIAAAHAHSVARHKQRIAALKQNAEYAAFFRELTGERLRRLSRLHLHFGASVFLAGPECIPEDFPPANLPRDYVFTVPREKTGS